jgi:hypothetical protein
VPRHRDAVRSSIHETWEQKEAIKKPVPVFYNVAMFFWKKNQKNKKLRLWRGKKEKKDKFHSD